MQSKIHGMTTPPPTSSLLYVVKPSGTNDKYPTQIFLLPFFGDFFFLYAFLTLYLRLKETPRHFLRTQDII